MCLKCGSRNNLSGTRVIPLLTLQLSILLPMSEAWRDFINVDNMHILEYGICVTFINFKQITLSQ